MSQLNNTMSIFYLVEQEEKIPRHLAKECHPLGNRCNRSCMHCQVQRDTILVVALNRCTISSQRLILTTQRALRIDILRGLYIITCSMCIYYIDSTTNI